MSIRNLAVTAAVLAFGGQLLLAQVNTGTISGVVRDSSGAVLPGASVVVENQDTGISRALQTNEAGRYVAPALNPGKYQVTVSQPGFQTEVRSGIALTVGREAVVDVTLPVGAVSLKVEVTGEAPLVELSNANLGGLIDDRTIRDLPLNGRSWDNLALSEPGIVKYGSVSGNFNSGSGSNKFSASGSRTYSNSFLLDGTDINDSSNGTPGGAAEGNLGVDTIKEFKIVANTFSAEYGRASGAVISAVTRTGTNELHGSVFEFLRNSALDALGPRDDPSDPPTFRRNQFGGTIGGPIQQDKLFFFGGYEGLRQALGTTSTALVPTLEAKRGILPNRPPVTINPIIRPFLALYPNPNGPAFKIPGTNQDSEVAQYFSAAPSVTQQDYFMGRVDYQLRKATNIFARYSFDDDHTDDPDNMLVMFVATKARRQYVTLQGNTAFTPTLLNAFRAAYSRTVQRQNNQPTPCM